MKTARLLTILCKSIADRDSDTHSKKCRRYRYFLIIVSPIPILLPILKLITEQLTLSANKHIMTVTTENDYKQKVK
jgi:hypothetical protein